MVKLITTNIVGSASNLVWSQAQTVTMHDNTQLMVVLQLACTEENSLLDLANIGTPMLAEIEKNGHEAVSTVLSETKEGLEVSLIVGTIEGSTMTLSGKGEVEGYLARNGKLAKLGTNCVGELESDDVVVLATNKFVEMVGLAKFKEILIEQDNPAEILAPLVHVQAETSSVAAVIGSMITEKEPISWPKINLRKTDSYKQMNLWIGGVILLLLFSMIGVGMVRRVKVIAESEFDALQTSVSAKIEETMSVGDLNPERARILLTQARGETQAYLASDIREEYKVKATKLQGEIELAEERAFKKNEINLSTIVELSILTEGLVTNAMQSDGKGNLVFLDKENKKVVAMNLSDRSRQIIDVDDASGFVDLGVSESKTYGLDPAGVVEMFWKKSDIKRVIEADEFWKDPKYIEIFAGNVYILDKLQGEIWKYPTLGDTFGGRRRWLAVGITPDLSNVVDMKVVGDIWLLTSTGKLERYSRGAPVSFAMEGFPAKGEPKRLSEPRALWVTDSLVYVLENGASRVVVFGTDGKYQSQYVNSEFARATDLVVVDGKAYVLIDNVVKEFSL